MALVETNLYVANTNALLRFPYRAGETKIGEPGTGVAALPPGEVNEGSAPMRSSERLRIGSVETLPSRVQSAGTPTDQAGQSAMIASAKALPTR